MGSRGQEVPSKVLHNIHTKYVDWVAVLSCSLAFCIYLNTLHAGFVYDDSRAILTNKDVLHQETPWQDIWRDDFWGTPLTHSGSHKSFRPLTILSFRVNRYFSGFNPWSYHLTNAILHTITTWLFVRVARVIFNLSHRTVFHTSDDGRKHHWTTSQTFALLVSGLLFASHPIHTEAVAGVVGRADVGATAFALASFLFYCSHVKRRNNYIASNNGCNYCPLSKSNNGLVTTQHQNPLGISLNSFLHLPSMSYLVASVAFAGASMLCKEHGIMVLFICAVYDITISTIRFRFNKRTVTSIRELECGGSTLLLGIFFLALFNLRLSVMGGVSPPQFAKADNPTAHHSNIFVRTMTFLYLPIFNLSLLLYPHPLSYDWSMDAVQQIESLWDSRNILTFIFYAAVIRGVRKIVSEITSFVGQQQDATPFKNSPVKIPCKICRFSIVNHKCSNNNNSIVVQPLSDSNGSTAAATVPQTLQQPLSSSKSSSRSSVMGSPKNGIHNHRPSISPLRLTKSSKRQSPSSSSRALECGAVLIQLAFVILPFLPASNLFLYVGFVVAERVLYFPSVGFCLLVGYGFSQVYSRCDRLRRSHSLMKAILVAGLIATIVMMSLGTLRRNEDWRDEGRLYRAGIMVNPPKSWGNLGNVLNSQGRLADAEEAYRQALRFRPNMAEVHYNLGLVLERQGKVEDALASYRTAINFRQQLASAYVNAGQLLARLGRINQAMDMYRKCFNLNDDGVKDLRTHVEAKVSALLRFGKLLIEIEDAPKAAVNVYRQAVRIMPSDYDQKQSVYNAIGEALFRIGEIAEAESWFLEALKTKPDHVPAHLTYGKMLARNKTRLLEAERWFRRAKKIAPQDSSVYHHYGQFLAFQGRHAEAATAYVTAAALSPNDYDIVVGAANALRQSGNNKEAEVYYEKAVALRSQEARAHMNLGAILHVNGKYREAEQSYLMALRLKPSDDVTLLNLKKLRQLQARRNQFAMSCKNKNRPVSPAPRVEQKTQVNSNNNKSIR